MVKPELSSLLLGRTSFGRTSQSLETMVRQAHLEMIAIVTVDRVLEKSPASSTHDKSF